MVAVAAGRAVSRRARLACPDREMSDAATDIAPLADLDAAVRSLGIIPAASTPYRPLPNLTANLNSTFLTRTLTLGTAVHPRVLTQTTHSLTLTLSP